MCTLISFAWDVNLLSSLSLLRRMWHKIIVARRSLTATKINRSINIHIMTIKCRCQASLSMLCECERQRLKLSNDFSSTSFSFSLSLACRLWRQFYVSLWCAINHRSELSSLQCRLFTTNWWRRRRRVSQACYKQVKIENEIKLFSLSFVPARQTCPFSLILICWEMATTAEKYLEN